MEQRQWGKKCVQKDNRLPIVYNVKTFESVTKKVITLGEGGAIRDTLE